MENRIGFFEQFYVALVKHRAYKSLVGLPKRRHAVYVAGVTFLLMLIAYVIPMVSFVASLGGYGEFFTERMPAFSIASGKLTIARPLDFRINGIHVVMDDSVEAYTQTDIQTAEETIVYFSQTNVITNLSMIPVMLPYTSLGAQKIDNAYMAGLSAQFYGTVVLAGVVSWISQIVTYLVTALFYVLFGLSINRFSGANLSFGKLYTIALYAVSAFLLLIRLSYYITAGWAVFVLGLIGACLSVRALNVAILSFADVQNRL